MKNTNGYTFGLENESIIVDSSGHPKYKIGNHKTANLIISILNQRYPNLKNMLKPELDSCQIEIVNNTPHTTIIGATEEISECLFRLINLVEEFGLSVSQSVSPETNPPYLISDSLDPKIKDRYIKIDSKLKNLGVRDCTNISGLHINIGNKENNKILHFHKRISEYLYDLLINNKLPLHMDNARYNKYKKVTDAIGESYLPIIVNDKKDYLDFNGLPIQQGHSLVRLKKYGDKLVSEIRSPDSGTSISDLYNKTKDYELFLNDYL